MTIGIATKVHALITSHWVLGYSSVGYSRWSLLCSLPEVAAEQNIIVNVLNGALVD